MGAREIVFGAARKLRRAGWQAPEKWIQFLFYTVSAGEGDLARSEEAWRQAFSDVRRVEIDVFDQLDGISGWFECDGIVHSVFTYPVGNKLAGNVRVIVQAKVARDVPTAGYDPFYLMEKGFTTAENPAVKFVFNDGTAWDGRRGLYRPDPLARRPAVCISTSNTREQGEEDGDDESTPVISLAAARERRQRR